MEGKSTDQPREYVINEWEAAPLFRAFADGEYVAVELHEVDDRDRVRRTLTTEQAREAAGYLYAVSDEADAFAREQRSTG